MYKTGKASRDSRGPPVRHDAPRESSRVTRLPAIATVRAADDGVLPACRIAVLARWRHGTRAWNRWIFHAGRRPGALSMWYRDCLGLDADENGLWRQGAGLTVFATFESETGYFGSRA